MAWLDFPDTNITLIDTMSDEILDTIDYTRGYADEMREELSASLENLLTVVGAYQPGEFNINTTVGRIDGPSFPEQPSFADLALDYTFPDTPTSPTLEPYGDLDFTFTSPTLPAEIDPNFDWSASVYTSDMWTALFTKTHNDIESGGTGLTTEVHGAIVDREQNARRINQDREATRAVDVAGAMGFNLPSGHIAAIVRDVVTENGIKDQDSLNNITIKDFELAQNNTQFAVTSGVELEKFSRDTFNKAEQLGFDATKAAKDFVVMVYAENIKAYIASWDGVKIRLEALQSKIEAITSMNEGKEKVFLGQLTSLNTQVSAIVSKNQGLIDGRKGEVEVYQSTVQAVATEYQSLVEEAKLQMESIRTEATLAIEEEKISLESYTSQAKLASDVARDVANITAQSVASALGAINVGMNNTFNGAESRRESFNLSATQLQTL